MNGFNGKMLFVDLTNGTTQVETFDEKFAQTYVGGYGFGARILLERMPAGADPLGPDSMLGFITGPTNATGPLFGGRYTVVHKSPVTGGWNDANSGGFFGPELKRAGFDAIFFTGISEKPVYLWIKDGEVELRDASHLWGQDCKEVWETLKQELDPRVRVATIGSAGENLLLSSNIINDGHRAAGRGGCGAVMGSKKLKAIAVRGTGAIEVADKDTILSVNQVISSTLADPPAPLAGYLNGNKKWGTTSLTYNSALSGDSPVKNWGGSGIVDFGEQRAAIFKPEVGDQYLTSHYGCAQCPMRCGAEYRVDTGKWPLGNTERPEYETAAAYGCNCLNDDFEAVMKCNEICNRAGIDTITGGSIVAWVMECYDNGVLTKEELDGIEANWGNAEAIVALTEKIAAAEGCGKIIGNGQLWAANYYGKGHEYLTTASGIELGMHDPRMPGVDGYIRAFQYDPTPGRHVKGGDNRTPLSDPNRGNADVAKAAGTEILNTSGMCLLGGAALPPNATNNFVGAVLGFDFTPELSLTTGRRIWMLRHAFNLREGITRDKMDIAPRIAGNPPIATGPNAGIVREPEKAGDLFYEAMGCDLKTGMPKREVLEQLGGLEIAIEQLGL